MNSSEQEKSFGIGVYGSRGITLVKGSGATVWDDQGREYIDCTAGIGVASVGHGNMELAEAIEKQARELMTCAGVFPNDVRGQCMEKLVSISPDGLVRVFLCNSGTESIEGAIKFARQSTGRSSVVSAMRGFHGRTFGALSATAKKDYQEPFQPLVPGFVHAPYNRIDAFDQVIDENTAAVMLELVQGEGGVRPADREFISAVAEFCSSRGALLVIDEIQTGFCRTGRMFASEHYSVTPDILCLAKGMAGGVPMGAILVNDKVKTAIGTHGSTFGGNPLACAAFLATIKIMEQQDLAQRAAELGDEFVRRLIKNQPKIVREVRHLGLMIGIELRKKATPLIKQMQEQGVLVLPAGSTVIRLLPPLVIEKKQLDVVLKALVSVLHTA